MIYVLRQWKDGQVSGLIHHLERNRVPFQILEAYQLRHHHYPEIRRQDAVIGLGGPPSVCRLREADYPDRFLLDEERFHSQVERDGIPFLGICLSHQLRAKMADHDVCTGENVFSLHPVDLTSDGQQHWLFEGLPAHLMMYQNHSDYVATLPASARLLASSPTCQVEAAAWTDRSVSTQFHPEVLGEQIVPVLRRFPQALEAAGLTVEDVLARMPPNYDIYTARLFDNFLYRAGCIRRPGWRETSLHTVPAAIRMSSAA